MSPDNPVLNVALVAPEIPPNTGNIARLCAATGVRLHLVEPLGFKIDDRNLKRAGLDYWRWVDVVQWSTFEEMRLAHPEARFFLFSSKVHRPYTRFKYERKDFLVFGNETRGLSEEILRRYPESTATIPMWGVVRSLNLSTSVGIVVYEALRQIKGF
jgi:tRNA (cytidine/uridine-2'-O-)-methyltransferase